MKQQLLEDTLNESGNSSDHKEVPILSLEVLNNPNMSSKRKLVQIERYEQLYRLHEDVRLYKCLISHFLLCTVDNRIKLLSLIDSDIAKDIEKPSTDDIPELPLSLVKILEDVEIGGDKGFDHISANLLNINNYKIPVKVKNSKIHRLSIV